MDGKVVSWSATKSDEVDEKAVGIQSSNSNTHQVADVRDCVWNVTMMASERRFFVASRGGSCNKPLAWAAVNPVCVFVVSVLRVLTLTSTTRSRWYDAWVKELHDLPGEALLYKFVNRERLKSFVGNCVQLC